MFCVFISKKVELQNVNQILSLMKNARQNVYTETNTAPYTVHRAQYIERTLTNVRAYTFALKHTTTYTRFIFIWRILKVFIDTNQRLSGATWLR